MKIWSKKDVLYRALSYCNTHRYNNNLQFNRIDQDTKNALLVTLRVRSSRESGHRLGMSPTPKGNRRRLISACWHVHRDFFSVLFDMCPTAKVKTGWVTYENQADFMKCYPQTAVRKVSPSANITQLCECEEKICSNILRVEQ